MFPVQGANRSELVKDAQGTVSTSTSDITPPIRICWNCGKPGHFQRDCVKKEDVQHQDGTAPTHKSHQTTQQGKQTFKTVLENWSCNALGTNRQRSEMFGAKTTCEVQLLGRYHEALVDTGSQVSILPLDLLVAASNSEFDIDADVEEVKVDKNTSIYDASGRMMSFKGAVRLSLGLKGKLPRRVWNSSVPNHKAKAEDKK
ncbi:unnamed protein product [Heligmosomoides polygyrus]|uniref:CCHC-type domain-containing protein n=1 Tax=Heligmosomoides polygyrus TaxID=6339 RepID=A0A183FC14_HELPZ|nr:unnamed protein product [Heligmosomoides polygyrus]